ncbi:hypothetical protein RQP54_15785 [Curvibacter sp. APW13]|uniref:hypothetical protein n=1 Tax=Curvibacter sp. APW13 TaxID=3077236 RepID=UPI0028DD51F4|nr:hypothetical protein [Curvibacter sp. APW13]MDT8992333.1 hypothetical protein [Curvibacter sp. APW13]
MLKKLVFTASTLLMVGATFAQAPAPTPAPVPKPSIDTRQATQEQRIQQGVQSGSLTTKEAARLEKGESRIDTAQNRAAADGKVTKNEQRHLEKMTNQESKAIYKQKHDRQNDRDHDGMRDRHEGGHKKK